MSDTRVATAEQAAILLDNRQSVLLGRLAERPVGASELARALDRPLSSVHAALQRLLRAGLVEQVSSRPRAGPPVRQYRLPVPWIIPFEVTPAATLRDLLAKSFEERLNEHLDALAAFMTRVDGRWAVTVSASDGIWQHTIAPINRPAEPQPVIFAQGIQLRLSKDRAREFGVRLRALMDEFAAEPSATGREWAFTGLLTPGRGS
ncbi:helix-turn-helix domain-containing protein (plasmid) [Deinococcus sp. KNUC1210]|uniref:helix-turn-helix domain-containing protein n=1 Tax=Deinococcus sp. KNUC1210 TaxID=2917691 RepID=UPI001EEF8E71|nr:helix-turn-helix domain-containing protein [Deinococcus sp. KNUC1210]ULH14059.1 helix-turn-helix domain-containing protein [Deinococcus sp. KNUC1210]